MAASAGTKGSIVNIVGISARAGSGEFTIGESVNVALLNFTEAMVVLDWAIRAGRCH